MKLIPVSLLMLGSASLALAEPVAIESFIIGEEGVGYQADISLQSQTGENPSNTPPAETGFFDWAGAWVNTDTDADIDRYVQGNEFLFAQVVPGSLIYSNLASRGGKLWVKNGGNSLIAEIDNTGNGTLEEFITEDGVVGQNSDIDSSPLYVSFMMQLRNLAVSGNQNYIYFRDGVNTNRQFNDGEQTFVRNPSNRMQIGQSWNNAFFGASGNGNFGEFNTDVQLCVMKIEFNPSGVDTVTIWWNPDISMDEASQTIDHVTNREMSFDHLEFKSQQSGEGEIGVLFDEIRFGKSFADVVPQAASYTLTVNEGTGGSVTVTPSSDDDTYLENTQINLEAFADAGFRFVEWSGDIGNVTATDIDIDVILTANTTINATFEAIPTFNVTVATDPVSGGGDVFTDPDVSAPIEEGTEVEFEAVASGNFEFVEFQIDEDGNVTTSTDNPYFLTVSADTTVTAVFSEPDLFNVTINVNPAEGGNVTADVDGPYEAGTNVTLTATPAAGYTFVDWVITGSGDPVTVTANPGTVTVTEDLTVETNFALVSIWDIYSMVDIWRDTEIGFVWDELYPFAYSFNFGWMYIFPGATADLYFAYRYTDEDFTVFFNDGGNALMWRWDGTDWIPVTLDTE